MCSKALWVVERPEKLYENVDHHEERHIISDADESNVLWIKQMLSSTFRFYFCVFHFLHSC